MATPPKSEAADFGLRPHVMLHLPAGWAPARRRPETDSPPAAARGAGAAPTPADGGNDSGTPEA